METLLSEMCARVLRHADGILPETRLPRVGLGVMRRNVASAMTLYEPMVCVALQGAKEVLIGDRVMRYGAGSCFVASLDLPATGWVFDATDDKPYVVASLALDRDVLADLLADVPPAPAALPAAGFGVAPVTTALLDAWDRLLDLLDTPADIPHLAPSREREVLYRLLQGAHGPMLRQIAQEDSRLSRVRRVMAWIRDHFDQTVRIEALAGIAGMSGPSLYRHFKAATAMSPLQYQKALRLQSARRMLMTNAGAARTAYAVGYESASQFSREYTRSFGMPPARDAERLRSSPVAMPPDMLRSPAKSPISRSIRR